MDVRQHQIGNVITASCLACSCSESTWSPPKGKATRRGIKDTIIGMQRSYVEAYCTLASHFSAWLLRLAGKVTIVCIVWLRRVGASACIMGTHIGWHNSRSSLLKTEGMRSSFHWTRPGELSMVAHTSADSVSSAAIGEYHRGRKHCLINSEQT